MTRIPALAVCAALGSLGVSACEGGNKPVLPSATWLRPWASWNLEKLSSVCGSVFRTYQDGRLLAWFDDTGPYPHIGCNARVVDGALEHFSILADAPSSEVMGAMGGALNALLQELPPDVGGALESMLESQRNEARAVRGMTLEVRYETVTVDPDLVKAYVFVGHR